MPTFPDDPELTTHPRDAGGAGEVLSRRGVTPVQWRPVLGMAAFILLLHVAGWGVLATLVASDQLPGGSGAVFGFGLGLTAYTLGMRHAFDADHVAAIDNTTRKQLAEGGRPVSVGFWFSLGHSSVVFALVALLASGVRSLAVQLQDESSALQQFTGVAGTVISGLFLLLIAVLTLPVLFAAGMTLLDTADGLLMYHAYGWANLRPVRKVYYNIAITGLSVAVALVIGGIELISVLAERLGIHTGPLAAIAALDLGDIGFLMVALFAAVWAVAVAVWKLGRIEERWT